MLPLTVKLRALQEAEEARAADDAAGIGECEGYAVWDEDGRIGTVVRTRIRPSGPPASGSKLAVRTGLFGRRVVLISATEVDRCDPGQRRVVLKPRVPGTWAEPAVGHAPAAVPFGVRADDLALIPALERLVQTTTTKALRVEFVAVFSDGTRLAPAIETATYRIVQEAITNAVRHSNARTISVRVIEHEGHLVSMIEDDGDGFHTDQIPGSSRGLKGMHEHATTLDGTITVQSTPRHGTAIRARIPITRPDREGVRGR
jgi:histidine kinase/DNA gyrase B/HSP90-like ATPase